MPVMTCDMTRTVVITGAAGSLGTALVRCFLADGANVLAVDRNLSVLGDQAGAPALKLMELDLTTPAAASTVAQTAGRIDVLINNAAVLDRLALIDETTEQEWRRVIEINLTIPFLLCSQVVPDMARRGSGVILNIGSPAGLRGGRAGAAYTASKHGLIGLTRNIAATFGAQGLRAVTLIPGGILPGMGRDERLSERGLRLNERDRDRPPRGRPQEVADVAVFVASDAARRINGTEIVIDAAALAF